MDFSQGIKANLNAPFRIIYSREARKKIRAVLDDFQPDVVHLNNIQYHLTPSIILETNKWRKETRKECKIVYTTHDYQLVCPSHGMFDVNIPELIEPGKTGELFEAGNVEELMKAIKKVLQTQDVLERYTKNCSQVNYETTESYYIKLMKIYRGEKNAEQVSS